MSSRVYTTLIVTFLHCTSTTKKNCTQTETIAPNIDIYFSNALTINVTMSLNEPVHFFRYLNKSNSEKHKNLNFGKKCSN
jgi:hypothetical protein